jgi:hypothetical protein
MFSFIVFLQLHSGAPMQGWEYTKLYFYFLFLFFFVSSAAQRSADARMGVHKAGA